MVVQTSPLSDFITISSPHKETPHPLAVTPYCPLPPPPHPPTPAPGPGQPLICSQSLWIYLLWIFQGSEYWVPEDVSMCSNDETTSGPSFMWNHATCDFLRLTSFPQHVSRVHPCFSVCQFYIPSLAEVILHCMIYYILHSHSSID